VAPKAVLVGLPGSGKSTIGRRLAKALDVGMLDTDAAIEQQTGRTIADIFATDGEQEFRRVEEEVIRAALESHDGVLSLGGGLFGYTWMHLELLNTGYRIVALEREERDLAQEERRLNLETAYLASPQQIEARASRELGMQSPTTDQVVFWEELP